jgi:hypothetical protein
MTWSGHVSILKMLAVSVLHEVQPLAHSFPYALSVLYSSTLKMERKVGNLFYYFIVSENCVWVTVNAEVLQVK